VGGRVVVSSVVRGDLVSYAAHWASLLLLLLLLSSSSSSSSHRRNFYDNFCPKICHKVKKMGATYSQNKYRSIKHYIEISLQQIQKCPSIVRIVNINRNFSVGIKRNNVAFKENTLNDNLLKLKRIFAQKIYMLFKERKKEVKKEIRVDYQALLHTISP
jgi:DNA-binding Lrp family transcriptional regulator